MTAIPHLLPQSVAQYMMQGLVEALCGRPGETPARRDARAHAVAHEVMAFQPRDPVEIMLAGMVVTHAALILDTARDVMGEAAGTVRARTKALVVSLDRAMMGFLKELRLARARPVEEQAVEGQAVEAPVQTRAAPPARTKSPVQASASTPASGRTPSPAPVQASASSPALASTPIPAPVHASASTTAVPPVASPIPAPAHGLIATPVQAPVSIPATVRTPVECPPWGQAWALAGGVSWPGEAVAAAVMAAAPPFPRASASVAAMWAAASPSGARMPDKKPGSGPFLPAPPDQNGRRSSGG